MVKVRAVLVISVLLTACGSDPESLPVIGYDQNRDGCSDPEECVKGDTEVRDLNGLRVIHKRTPGNPLVAVRVLMDSGASRTTTPLLAHAETMLLQLIDWYGSDEDLIGWQGKLADCGASLTARAGPDYSHVSLVVPAVNIGRGYQLLAGAVNHPPISLTDEIFESIKTGYAQGYEAAADDIDSAAELAAWDLFAAGHPYNEQRQHLDAISQVFLDDLMSVHARLRHGLPIVVASVGDMSLDTAVARASDAFGDFRNGLELPKVPEFTPNPHRRLKFVVREKAPAWHLYAYFRAPVPSDEDYAPLELGLRVLSSRLGEELRTKRGIVYLVTADVANDRANYGYLTLSTTDLEAATASFRDVLLGLVRDGIEESEIEGERAQYLTNFYRQAQSVESVSWTLGDWQMTSGDWRLAASHLSRIEKVDASAAREAVARYVDDLRYGIAGPKTGIAEEQLTGQPPLPPEPDR